MNTDEMIDFLADFYFEAQDAPNLAKIVWSENVSFPLAVATQLGFATPTESGISEMTITYNYLRQLADERHIDDLWDLLTLDELLPNRLMTVTVKTDEEN